MTDILTNRLTLRAHSPRREELQQIGNVDGAAGVYVGGAGHGADDAVTIRVRTEKCPSKKNAIVFRHLVEAHTLDATGAEKAETQVDRPQAEMPIGNITEDAIGD